MKTLLLASIAVLLALPALAQKDGGWVDLFNGKNLDGWTQKNGTAKYSVQDATIYGVTNEGSPNSFLCTDKLYGDFELTFDVKVHDKLNSGVQIRSQTKDIEKKGKVTIGRVNGPQVEIESTPEKGAESGYVYGEACGGWMTPEADRAPHKHFKNGEWNSYRIIAKGAKIQTWVNGNQVSDLTDEAKFESHPKGFIGLQVHGIKKGSGPFDVAWRKLKIREL